MGRQVRRVALDFAWPMNKAYSGLIMPDALIPVTCPGCEGDGQSAIGKELHKRWWGYIPFHPSETGSEPFTPDTPGVMDDCRRKVDGSRAFYDQNTRSRGEDTVLLEAMRMCAIWNGKWQNHLSQAEVDIVLAEDTILQGLTHRWSRSERRWVRIDRPTPTQREVNIWTLGLGNPMVQLNCYAVQQAEAAKRGGTCTCATCGGEGSSFRDEAHRLAYDAWAPTEPPAGDGWQLWETVSEGSPITPVFATAEELARHMARRDASSDDGMDEAGWLRFVQGPGWSPSMVAMGSLVVPGHMAVAAEVV